MKTNYEKIGELELAYRENGSGTVIILLHGNSGSKAFFRKYQQKYFLNFHTYAIDSRGHGQSKSIDESYSISQYSEDIIKFCSQKGIAKAFVIGYSDGGNIALFLAKNAPNIFLKIVAISPNYLVNGTEEKSLKLIQRFVKAFIFLQKLGLNMKKPILRFKLMLEDIGLDDNDLKNIKTDMQILYAEKDMIKESHIKHMAELIPYSKLKKVSKCNHLNILNKPETIRNILEYFG